MKHNERWETTKNTSPVRTQAKSKSKSDTAMLGTHMVVDALASGERRQTLPTNMRLAARARHVVASLAPLNRRLATWTTLDVVVRRPFFEELVFGDVAFLARHAVVVLYAARWTDTDKTRGTLQDCVWRRRAIHLGAVGRGTVVELVWSTVSVHPESGLDDCAEIGCGQESPREPKRDTFGAGRIIPEAPQGEHLVLHRRGEVTGETCTTPLVTACERDGHNRFAEADRTDCT